MKLRNYELTLLGTTLSIAVGVVPALALYYVSQIVSVEIPSIYAVLAVLVVAVNIWVVLWYRTPWSPWALIKKND